MLPNERLAGETVSSCVPATEILAAADFVVSATLFAVTV